MVSLYVEFEGLACCAKHFLMLQILGKLKQKNKKGGVGSLAFEGDHGAEIWVTGRFSCHISE